MRNLLRAATHGGELQTIRGQVRLSLKDTELELPAGQIVTLASRVPHYLSARVDSVVLLVVAADR